MRIRTICVADPTARPEVLEPGVRDLVLSLHGRFGIHRARCTPEIGRRNRSSTCKSLIRFKTLQRTVRVFRQGPLCLLTPLKIVSGASISKYNRAVLP
ncbi:hypothetical protein THICB2_760095 [Thiomonas sp. CB2]|nr:hypothetical protein THICB2_760095 [Thiomonas sp. CB2]